MAQLEHIEAIEKRLWNAADTLRANSNYASNEYFLGKDDWQPHASAKKGLDSLVGRAYVRLAFGWLAAIVRYL